MKDKLVSIIIPTYNRAHLIGETLDSILAQTYNNWECIIVDDGSTDTTDSKLNDYASKDSRIKYFQRPKNRIKGANACRNYGFENSKGDYIMFFDSDDLFVDSCLEKRVSYMEENEVDMAIFSMGHFINSNELFPDNKLIVYNDSIKNTLMDFLSLGKLPWNIARPIFRRKLINEKTKFNEELLKFQDVEFNIKVLKLMQPKYKSINVIDCYYRLDEKKYHSKEFVLVIFSSLYHYYKSVISLFNNEERTKIKPILVKNFFNFIFNYSRGFVPFKMINKTLKVFRKELSITIKGRFAILSIFLLNKWHYNKKGYYNISRKLKKLVE